MVPPSMQVHDVDDMADMEYIYAYINKGSGLASFVQLEANALAMKDNPVVAYSPIAQDAHVAANSPAVVGERLAVVAVVLLFALLVLSPYRRPA